MYPHQHHQQPQSALPPGGKFVYQIEINMSGWTPPGIGGGPIIPPDQPPQPGVPGSPQHPIWGPPGFNPPGSGMPPGIWGGPIIPPNQPPQGPPGQPIHPIWGPPGFNPPGSGMPPGIWGGPIVPPGQPPNQPPAKPDQPPSDATELPADHVSPQLQTAVSASWVPTVLNNTPCWVYLDIAAAQTSQ